MPQKYSTLNPDPKPLQALARETSAPDYIIRALQGHGDAREKLVKARP